MGLFCAILGLFCVIFRENRVQMREISWKFMHFREIFLILASLGFSWSIYGCCWIHLNMREMLLFRENACFSCISVYFLCLNTRNMAALTGVSFFLWFRENRVFACFFVFFRVFWAFFSCFWAFLRVFSCFSWNSRLSCRFWILPKKGIFLGCCWILLNMREML